MITIRNPNEAHSRTVVASTQLEIGQAVKLIQGLAKGDPPQVAAIVEADLTDPTVMIGIVNYVVDDDQALDMILDPVNSALTLNTGDDAAHVIPAGKTCQFWYGNPVIGFHKSAVDPAFAAGTAGDFDAVREPAAICIDSTTSKIGLYAAGQADRDAVAGFVYQHEGAELTVLFTAF